MPECSRAEPREEAGQITVLIVGFVLLALVLASVVMAASTVYLGHKKLLSLADGAALAAADTFLVGDIGEGAVPSAALVDSRVLSAVDSYLQTSGAFVRQENLTVARGTGSEAGGTAVVVLTAVVRPPVVSFLLPDGILIEAKTTARSRLIQ